MRFAPPYSPGWPRPRSTEPSPAAHSLRSWTRGSTGDAASGRGLRILLAEDDETLRGLIVSALRRAGHQVVEASNGTECLGLAQPWTFRGVSVTPPDLIISDVRMPGWSGLEALHILRAGGADIPVILITAFGSPALHDQAAALGAAYVLDKPFDLRELVAVVGELAVLAEALRSSR